MTAAEVSQLLGVPRKFGRRNGSPLGELAARTAHAHGISVAQAAKELSISAQAATAWWHRLFPGERWIGYNKKPRRRIR